jgi:hypothetical protein
MARGGRRAPPVLRLLLLWLLVAGCSASLRATHQQRLDKGPPGLSESSPKAIARAAEAPTSGETGGVEVDGLGMMLEKGKKEVGMDLTGPMDATSLRRMLAAWGPKPGPGGSPGTAPETQADSPRKAEEDRRHVRAWTDDPLWAGRGLVHEWYGILTGRWRDVIHCQW